VRPAPTREPGGGVDAIEILADFLDQTLASDVAARLTRFLVEQLDRNAP
jgi:hypothetical protein